MYIIPCSLREANEFIKTHHRHHKPVPGCKFAIAAADDNDIHAVIVVGRPVARHLDDGWTLEVNRLASDGTKNACSMLYAAAWRGAKALGYKRLITYTLESEPGTSLRAAGWRLIGIRGGGSWSRKDRPRVDLHPTEQKQLWEIN